MVRKDFSARGSPRVTTLPSLLLPAGLLALAVFTVNVPWLPKEQLKSFLHVYPWVVLVLGVLLGVRFRRGRVVFALLALALADRTLEGLHSGAAFDGAARFAFAAAAFLLPLNLAWLALARERGTLTPRGLLRLALVLAQPALAAYLWLSYHPGLAALLERSFLPASLVPPMPLPHPALLAFAFAFAATAVAWARRRTYIESGFFWAVAASFLALADGGQATTAYLATAGLILVIALVEATFAMAYRDGLTGLPARRAFDEALTKLSGRYAIAMVDIDHFKDFNDKHGHDVGDQVLRFVAATIAEVDGTRAFRFGGEEFALIFPGRSRNEAAMQLEALRKRIEDKRFSLRGEDRPKKKPKRVQPRSVGTTNLKITVSAGAAEQGGRLVKPEEVLRAADEALYRAKRTGRNRVCT
ncbi:MAG TPA: GGDEF domain-containing protein [Thermoanaerobaculaceae bacterium]|nr:GGDEF domain-containing protein [Thermoanaerobaculaceae bacterium]